ncbi:MAG: aspartyl protease family protein [Phenylobacterium sp.]|uniref:aspartyl protease family protein n=1 Tax=Phenylobacterium sp. TaxID=1871053 RepID=UPI002732828D|nr:aspartyl protease family protein [Phenylobacterium sp.]MDP3174938.1 aspartyl protease family protein [Phenylobacterium sp.]
MTDTRRAPAVWSRRAALAGLAAAGCATPPTLVNLVQAPAPAPDGEVLETAFDPASRMTAPVRLDGAGPFPFVVDTGANVSVASLELADRLGLPRLGEAPVHGVAGVQNAPISRVGRLEVGQVSTSVPRLPLLPRGTLGVDGLLGMDILRGRRLLMDFRRQRIEITRSPSTSAAMSRSTERRDAMNPRFRVPARMRFGQLIIVDAEIAGVKLTAFIDTGSQTTIGNPALRQAVLRGRPEIAAGLMRAVLLSATGQRAVGELAPVPPIRLGGLLIGDVTVAFADLHIFDLWDLRTRPAILVGMDILRHFNRVEIDYGQRAVTFMPPPQSIVRSLR